MKKIIIIEIILILALIIFIYPTYKAWSYVYLYEHYFHSYFIENGYDIALYYRDLTNYLLPAIFETLGILLLITASVLLAIRDFPVFKPLIDRIKAKKLTEQK